jgi:hypothetical protein
MTHLFTGTTGPNEAGPLTTATCVDGDNSQTWLQPLVDRTNAVNEETARIKAETARLKKEVSALTTATTMPLYKELKGVIGILSIYRRSEVAS